METLLHRSWSTGNQTAQNIGSNIRELPTHSSTLPFFHSDHTLIIDWRLFVWNILCMGVGRIGRGLLILCSENIRVLKNQFESEANSIRHEMDALRELHHVSLESPTSPASPFLLPPPLSRTFHISLTTAIPLFDRYHRSGANF
jgi:hypothetical protein